MVRQEKTNPESSIRNRIEGRRYAAICFRPMSESGTLVLRFPRKDGDHVYRVAKLKPEALRNLNAQISQGTGWERFGVFGPPLDLSEAVGAVNTRDFVVLEIRE